MLSRRLFRFIPGRLLAVNLTLAALSMSLAAYIIWELQRPFPADVSPRSGVPLATAPMEASLAPVVAATPVIAQRNLFSPTRTESSVTLAAAAGLGLSNPSLYGVVLGSADNSVAYLQDPATKRVAGYRVGDSIAGGIIRAIDADRVVIDHHGTRVDIRLRDPQRPRPAVASMPEASEVREAAVASTNPTQQGPTPQRSPLFPRMIMPPSRNYRSPFQRLVPPGGLPAMTPQESPVPARAATAG